MLRRRNTALQTNTPAFKRWFKDSKVVDAQGQPLVVYHGTNAHAYSPDERIETFGTSSRGGAFFSSDPRIAGQYGERVYAVYLRLENPLIVDAGGHSWADLRSGSRIEGRITPPVRAALRKQAARWLRDVDELADLLADFGVDAATPVFSAKRNIDASKNSLSGHTLGDLLLMADNTSLETDDVAKAARTLGFDGVVFKNVQDSPTSDAGYSRVLSDVYAAFSPTQVKSATMNAGTFDPDDPSMLRNPRRRNPRAWHGSARALQQFRAPAFFADDRKAARWFAVERAGAEPGVLMEVELDIQHPATSADLIRAAKAVGVAVVETPYFEAPEVNRYAPYDGSNPLDLVYIPKVRAELLKRGFDGVRGWDLLEADEIEVWITLRDDQATVVSTHLTNPHRRTRR